MDPAWTNARRPRPAPAVVEQESDSASDRRSGATRPSSGRPPARQGKSLSAVTTGRPGDTVDYPGTAVTADLRQAEYFIRVLTECQRQSEQRIENYRRAIARAEAHGDTENAQSFRRLMRAEDMDRQDVEDMLEGMVRRFPLLRSGGNTRNIRRARSIVS
jgi:hypothetical protein